VATMDFLRNALDVPVPRVLAHSSTVDNSVGAEYIIMERF
jgi:aminoglycoside phosphotransferase (APT) family kinase protein